MLRVPATLIGVGQDGILHRTRDRDQGGLVEDGIDARGRLPAGREVADVAFDELDRLQERGEVRALPGQEIIQDPDPGPPADEDLDDVRSDEARAPRHQIGVHRGPGLQVAQLLEPLEDLLRALLEGLLVGLDEDLGLEGLFIGIGDAR